MAIHIPSALMTMVGFIFLNGWMAYSIFALWYLMMRAETKLTIKLRNK